MRQINKKHLNTNKQYENEINENTQEEELMGFASLVLGIISLVIGVFSSGLLGWLGAIIALIGVILGVLERKKPDKSKIATAGMVCSIVGLVLCLLLYVACAACVGSLASL